MKKLILACVVVITACSVTTVSARSCSEKMKVCLHRCDLQFPNNIPPAAKMQCISACFGNWQICQAGYPELEDL